MKIIVDGDAKEIAALVAALQERKISTVDITQQIAKGLSSQLASSHIPE